MDCENDRHAPRPQLAYERDQILRHVLGQRGRRLIHEKDFGVEGERFRNLDQLLLGDDEVGDESVRPLSGSHDA